MGSVKFTHFYLIILILLSIAGQLSGQTLSLSVDQELVNEATSSIKATVIRSGDPNESLEITLEVSDDGVLFAPSIVTIKADEISVEFDIAIVNDGLIDGEQSATLTAKAENYTSSYVNIIVADDDTESRATLSGHLYGTLMSGEYEVINSIIVDSNRNLVIESNTILSFLSGNNINFEIYGSLEAVGNSTEPIVFISSSDIPQPGDWSGISLLGNKKTILDNVYISHAGRGIAVYEGTIDNVTIIRSNITDNTTGIYVKAYSSKSKGQTVSALIKDNEIAFNTESGLYLLASSGAMSIPFPKRANVSCQIEGNYIHHNEHGIYGFSDCTQHQNVTRLMDRIHNNIIIYNINNGIFLKADSHGHILTEVCNNTIAFNGDAGIEHSESGSPEFKLTNNIITDNKHGIRSIQPFSIDNINNCTIQFNNVFNNILDTNDMNWVNYPSEYGDLTIINANGTPADLEMNISVNPFFVQHGYWEENETPEDPNDDFWVDGDYHLKSQYGRGDPNSGSWVIDDVTSPCIDAGGPNSPVGDESFPNGDRINMGAYGGTIEASKSYIDESLIIYIDEDDADSQVVLEQGQYLVVTLESNPTTGYRWEVVENQDSILEQVGEVEFKPSEQSDPPIAGAGGWEIFRFKAVSAGQMTLEHVYRRSWETDVEPVKTFSIEVIVN